MEPKCSMTLKNVLKDFIADYVSLSDDVNTKAYKETLKKEIEEKLIEAMKRGNSLFAELYQNVFYTGSVYEGLRIKEADEFDFNIRLKLPFKPADITIEYKNIPSGYVRYKLNNRIEVLLANHPKWEIYKKLVALMDENKTFLSQEKVNRWMTHVVDVAMSSSRDAFKNFERKTSGPAITLHVKGVNGKVLDVDLVPVVELSMPPGSIRQRSIPDDTPKELRTIFIVPKPTPTYTEDKRGTLWRVSLPGVEMYLIRDKGCLKPLIKIFKAIRDHYNWSFIASYFIKTMFLFEAQKHPGTDFWLEVNLDKLFIMMLEKFIEAMTQPLLNHYFFNNANLLEAVKPDTAGNVKGRLERILKMAQNEPTKLLQLLSNGANPVRTGIPVSPCNTLMLNGIPPSIIVPTQNKDKQSSRCVIS